MNESVNWHFFNFNFKNYVFYFVKFCNTGAGFLVLAFVLDAWTFSLTPVKQAQTMGGRGEVIVNNCLQELPGIEWSTLKTISTRFCTS